MHCGRWLSTECATRTWQTHPEATVVALAEGFQTSFSAARQRTTRRRIPLGVIDLPPVIALRERLLPSSPRIVNLAQSALDYSWMDPIDDTHGVFITAEGLLMYLRPDEAMELITQCAKRFPGGQMFFDLPPVIVKKCRKGLRSSKHYRVPPMPFSLSTRELADLVDTVPGVRAVHDIPMPKGRGMFFKNRVSGGLEIRVDQATPGRIRVTRVRLSVRGRPMSRKCPLPPSATPSVTTSITPKHRRN